MVVVGFIFGGLAIVGVALALLAGGHARRDSGPLLGLMAGSLIVLAPATFLLRSYSRHLRVFLAGDNRALAGAFAASRRMWICFAFAYGLTLLFAIAQVAAQLMGVEIMPVPGS